MRVLLNFSKVLLLTLAITILSGTAINAQITTKGRDFWFGYMANYDQSTNELWVFISSDSGATGTISVPNAAWSQDFSVGANSTFIIEIPQDYAADGSETIEGKAVHVVSDKDINVFTINYCPHSTDGTIILPTNALGDMYYVIDYPEPSGMGNVEFLVVATEDNTVVQISPIAATSGGHSSPFNVTLSRGEIYQVQSTSDLTGSTVKSLSSTKPIAVFGGDMCTQVPNGMAACDHLYEQMFPVRAWGIHYTTVPLKTRLNGDRYRIIADKNNTTVQIRGTANSDHTINSGEFVEIVIDGPSKISADKAICVAQYSNSYTFDGVIDSDPFFIILSPDEQPRTDITFHVYGGFTTIPANYLNVVAHTSHVNDLTLDGVGVGAQFSSIAADPTFAYAQLNVAEGAHRLASSTEWGFLAYVYGYGNTDSYGYSAGARLDTLSFTFTQHAEGFCAGVPTDFSATTPWPVLSYLWEFGDGATSTIEAPSHAYATGGKYNVTLTVTKFDGSETKSLTREVVITSVEAEFSLSGGGCGNPVVIFTDESVPTEGNIESWRWEFDDGTTSTSQNPSHTYTHTDTFNIKLIVTTENGCVDSVYHNIAVYLELPVAKAGADTSICFGTSGIIGKPATGGLGPYTYSWQPTTGLSSTSIASPEASPLVTTTYIVLVTDDRGCTDKDTTIVTVLPLPEPVITPSGPTTFCSCDSVTLDAGIGYSFYLWSRGDTTQTIVVRDPGNYAVTVTDSHGCVNTSDSILITVIYPHATIGFSDSLFRAEPGATLNIPLVILNSENLDTCNVRSFVAVLSFNKTLISPSGSTEKGDKTGPNRILTLDSLRGSSDTLVNMQFMATLGNAERTPLTINSFEWTDCPFDVDTIPSAFMLINLCKKGNTTRLYDYQGSAILLEFKPNPVEHTANIEFHTPETGVTKLYLANVLGKTVYTLLDEYIEKGAYKRDFDLSYINSGLYYLVLETPTMVYSKILEVSK